MAVKENLWQRNSSKVSAPSACSKQGPNGSTMAEGFTCSPFAGPDTHYWRLDYSFEGRRKTLSLGSHPQVSLAMARKRASEARTVLAAGLDPTNERRNTRVAQVQAEQAKRRALAGLPQEGTGAVL